MQFDEKTIKINEDLTLIQKTNGLAFGTDAYLLAAFVKGGKHKKGADLGSGSGVIPLLCASKQKCSHMYAIELQSPFAELIERNAELNGLTEKITSICNDVRNITASDTYGELDFVCSNPPYMKADSGKRNTHDEKFIARHEANGGIEDFCACAKKLLKFGGKFYIVWRPDRLCDLFCALRANRLEPKNIVFVSAYPKLASTLVLTEAVYGASPSMKLPKTLYLHDSAEDAASSKLSTDASHIYDTCSFEDFLAK